MTASPDHVAPHVVGHLGHHAHLGAAGGEQRDDFVLAHLLPERDAVEDLGHRPGPTTGTPAATAAAAAAATAATAATDQHRRRHLAARAPCRVTGQAFGVGDVEHREDQIGVEPRRRVMRESWIHRQPCCQHMPRVLRRRAQRVQRGPGPLGVHVVGRDRRDPAPVVDAGRQQRRQLVGEVRRRLNVHLGRQHQAGHGDGPQQVVGRAGLGPGHGGTRLGEEVLDDDLLHVAEAGMRRGDGLQCGELAGPVVADAHQDSRREGDVELAGRIERGQTAGRLLVRCAAVRVEVLGQRLDHHALAGRKRAQRC